MIFFLLKKNIIYIKHDILFFLYNKKKKYTIKILLFKKLKIFY